MSVKLDRRAFVTGAAGVAGFALAGCDRLAGTTNGQSILAANERITYAASKLLPAGQLAPEYDKSAISAFFKPNGSIDPKSPAYKKLVGEKFAPWTLEIGGLVDKPAKLTLADLRALPARTQITRHDCVEGWSCIGEWKGVQLSTLLDKVGVKNDAHFVVFHCFDSYDTDYTTENADQPDELPPRFYGSIGILDAVHPQTILAYNMNGAPLPAAHGAPLRLRIERQLGYKNTKYIDKIELVSSFAEIGQGKGGYWEDNGYNWYGGI